MAVSSDERIGDLVSAQALIDRELYYEALVVLDDVLQSTPHSAQALFLYGSALLLVNKPGAARPFLEIAYDEEGKTRWQVPNALGRCYSELNDEETADEYFQLAYDLAPTPEHQAMALANRASVQVRLGAPEAAIPLARQALALNSHEVDATTALSFSLLAMGEWKEGWRLYAEGMGFQRGRDARSYADPPEPCWVGVDAGTVRTLGRKSTVVVYGEQGLGDEILLGNALLDVDRLHDGPVVYECHRKLESLMRRSFPGLEVHGTRQEGEADWVNNRKISASCSLSELQCATRKSESSWTGEPWLVPDWEKVEAWRERLADMPKPWVGIAWTGGGAHTQRDLRSAWLGDWVELVNSLPGTLICLEYGGKYTDDECLDHGVLYLPEANETENLDDQASLVAALDAVVAVPTTVVHLAGALGVPTVCIVHDRPHFFFGPAAERRTTMPQYGCVRLVHRDGESWPLDEVRTALERLDVPEDEKICAAM